MLIAKCDCSPDSTCRGEVVRNLEELVAALAADRAHPVEPAGEPARHHQVHRRVAGRAAGGAEGGARGRAGARADSGADPAASASSPTRIRRACSGAASKRRRPGGHWPRDTDRATAALGIAREKRAFSPHLTLARIKEPCGLAGAARGHRRAALAGVRQHSTARTLLPLPEPAAARPVPCTLNLRSFRSTKS